MSLLTAVLRRLRIFEQDVEAYDSRQPADATPILPPCDSEQALAALRTETGVSANDNETPLVEKAQKADL